MLADTQLRRRRARITAAGPTQLTAVSGPDRQQQHSRRQDDLTVPRPSCAGARSSSCSSSCSIWRPSFSDFRSGCMRRILAIHSLRCSISAARVFNCASSFATLSPRSCTRRSLANRNDFRAAISSGRSEMVSMRRVYARPTSPARCSPGPLQCPQ